MKTCFFKTTLLLLLFPFVASIGIAATPIDPVTPNALPETVALLELFQSISGTNILTGQHNYPATMDKNSKFAKKFIGK
ncbi:MAG: hypothetical protein PF541_14795 [Prolixibacteraceae bacterium]|jgi:hypothetical protein|nr:hypothetical protein [Prolixibacteraceae bacterium]